MCILSYSALINIPSTFGLYIMLELEIYGICACSGKSGIKGEERGGYEIDDVEILLLHFTFISAESRFSDQRRKYKFKNFTCKRCWMLERQMQRGLACVEECGGSGKENQTLTCENNVVEGRMDVGCEVR